MDAAVKALSDAKDALVNIKALGDAIEAAEALAAQTDVYTEASLNIYKAAIADAKEVYERANAQQSHIDNAVANLKAAESSLVKKSGEALDKDNLANGTYSIVANLWHADQDKESMGNAALYHNAVLTVKDGVYTLTLRAHTMTVGSITGRTGYDPDRTGRIRT